MLLFYFLSLINMNHTKLIATIGPKISDEQSLESLAKGGVNIFRSNFSHCTHKEYEERLGLVKKIEKKLGKEIGMLQDLQGPRIRVGELPEEGLDLKEGEAHVFTFSTEPLKPGSWIIPVNDPDMHKDIKKGDPFYLANGELELVVTNKAGGKIHAEVVRGGRLFSRKGINLPQTVLKKGGLTAKDIKDAKFAASRGVDLIALSFVQSPEDIKKLRKAIGKKDVKIIAKIERRVALDNIDDIIKVSDGIMVARGDLGIEIPMEDVPIVQKNLVRHAHWHGKPVIIATQMLSSMVKHFRPTRAEVSDVANAVFDGADAVMLSDETAEGDYPLKAVQMATKIVTRTEKYLRGSNNFEKIA